MWQHVRLIWVTLNDFTKSFGSLCHRQSHTKPPIPTGWVEKLYHTTIIDRVSEHQHTDTIDGEEFSTVSETHRQKAVMGGFACSYILWNIPLESQWAECMIHMTNDSTRAQKAPHVSGSGVLLWLPYKSCNYRSCNIHSGCRQILDRLRSHLLDLTAHRECRHIRSSPDCINLIILSPRPYRL